MRERSARKKKKQVNLFDSFKGVFAKLFAMATSWYEWYMVAKMEFNRGGLFLVQPFGLSDKKKT